MAKQFGVGDAALEGLRDPSRHPFPVDQRAALAFADAMTEGPGRVSDEVYRELRLHFDDAQIVEIACVVGLFNYFNRFNNALHVEITLMDPDVLVRRAAGIVKQPDAVDSLDRALDLLHQGRRFTRTVLYSAQAGQMVATVRREAQPDPAAARIAAEVARTAVAVRDGAWLGAPLKRGVDVAGALVVESHRREDDDENVPLLERFAAILAPRL